MWPRIAGRTGPGDGRSRVAGFGSATPHGDTRREVGTTAKGGVCRLFVFPSCSENYCAGRSLPSTHTGDHDDERDIPPRWGALLMWDLLTSTGHRVTGIAHERDARRSIQSMGQTEQLSFHVYRVTPNRGPAFVAELRKGR